MIENIKYEDLESYSKELKASAEVIKELIKTKEIAELNKFADDVINYSAFLERSIKMHKSADETLAYLVKNRTS
ncbi:MAG: hypothetical protein IJ193_06475 [Bacilli bacterium]|nr:hypothetical protein [Bacilli bacterium]